jgi:hypothetical protein
MINFVLKYTGAYGLLAIVAVAIITPTYLFLSNQNEQLPSSNVKEEKGSHEKEVTKKRESIKKAEIKNNGTLNDKETLKKSEESLSETKKNKSTVSNNSLSVDIFRVDELGNIISAGKVSQKAKIEILSDELKIIGADTTDDDGSFVVFGKVQGTGLVQTVKIRGLIGDGVEEKIIDSTDLFFVIPKVEKNNEKEEKRIEKSPLIIKDDGNDLKLLMPIQVNSVNSITLDTISYSDSSDTELAGRARLNNSVRIYLDNKLEGQVRVNDSGAWKTSLSGIEAGIYTLRLDEVNSEGSVEGRLELPFKKEDQELIEAMGEGSITVQPGNSLWRIARKYYGKGIQYVEIFERNSHLIKDPDLIYPGQVFSLPN